jgi:hypothetical protein
VARETPDRGFAGGKPRADRLTAEQAFAELRRRQLQRPR